MLIGKQYGRYEIREKIGAGGMGEVYAAFDTQLDRQVALKILSTEFSADEPKKNRFRREARSASALNHPNIITIYEIGENEDELFLATELIEGKTLREIIQTSSLSLVQILKIVIQIADALAAAHAAHIVHRDVKPENVMVRPDGYVKVLDFGLAKLTASERVENPDTDEIIKTTPGMIMGSIRYMSPEQARGLRVDERTDIWSLGVVLFEMLTGKAPFDGATTSDTLANIIYKEPPTVSQFVPNAPPELEQVIFKSLQKETTERIAKIEIFAAELRALLGRVEHEISLESQKRIAPVRWETSENPTIIHQTASSNHPTQISETPAVKSETSGETKAEVKKTFPVKFALAALFIFAALVAFGFTAYRWFGAPAASAAFEKTQISRLASDGKVRLSAISPDGKYVAYASGDTGNRSLVVRQTATDSLITVVPPTPLDFRTLTFSPDGNHLLYTQSGRDFSVNTLYQVPALGGTPKKVIEDVDSMPTFSPDGKRLAFMRHVTNGGMDIIFTANADGSDIQQLLTTKETDFDFFSTPAWAPQGEKIIISAGNSIGGVNNFCYLVEISTADRRFQKFSERKWWKINDLVWLRDGSGFLITGAEKEASASQIWKISYPAGDIAPVTNDLNNYFNLAVTADASTAIAVKSDVVSSIWNFSPASKSPVQILPDSANYQGNSGIAPTPDGRLVYTRRDGKNMNLWIADADGKNSRQLTAENADDFAPTVSPDGKYIVFISTRSGTARLWRIDIDGKNPLRLTEETAASGDYNPVVTADGKSVLYNDAFVGNKQPSRLLKISIDGGAPTVVHSDSRYSTFLPQPSPDGKTLLFTAYNISTFEKRIYLSRFDGSTAGEPFKNFEYDLMNKVLWSPDGKSLSYWSVDGVPNIWKMPVDGAAKEPLTNFSSGRIANYAWSKDGKNLHIVRNIVNSDLILIKDVNKTKAE